MSYTLQGWTATQQRANGLDTGKQLQCRFIPRLSVDLVHYLTWATYGVEGR